MSTEYTPRHARGTGPGSANPTESAPSTGPAGSTDTASSIDAPSSTGAASSAATTTSASNAAASSTATTASSAAAAPSATAAVSADRDGSSPVQAPKGPEKRSEKTQEQQDKLAWGALWAIVIGFFMILVDSTIVSTAMPAVMKAFDTDINNVVWVTSAYLLAYAVPLLITGRLGDRFGPRNMYLTGLVLFTLSSLWCGLAPSIESLITARVVQGLGAAIMTPQTMAIITRLFPPHRRGAAMGIWGSVAGVASLVGPILGGVLVDSLGWEWIFFVNIPVGVIAFWRAWAVVPRFETHNRSLDWIGVILSAVGMFLIVFGIQEGHGHDWGEIWGAITVPELIIAGSVLMVLFVLWQRFTKAEPLVPLGLFRDRNFSIGNAAITMVGMMIASFALPYMLFLQLVRGFSPTQAALMMAPMAVISGVLAPFVGRALSPKSAPLIAVFGLALNAAGLFLYAYLMTPDTGTATLLWPSVLMGVGGACMWSPISVTTTRDLDRRAAGAGSGVYNATRQVGSVLGSSLIAMMMENRLTEHLSKVTPPHVPGHGAAGHGAAGAGHAAAGGGGEAAMGSGQLPSFLHDAYATAMGQSMWLPAAAVLVGMVLVIFFRRKPLPQEKKLNV